MGQRLNGNREEREADFSDKPAVAVNDVSAKQADALITA